MLESPPNAVSLTVSIVLYNSPIPLLDRCLASLEKAALTARDAGILGGLTLYLIDNASHTGYRQELASLVSRFRGATEFALEYRPLEANRGFGAGHNSVLDALDSDFHIILNPDAELSPLALQSGLDRMVAEPATALLSPRVTGANGEQEFLCKAYPSVFVLLLRGFAPQFVRRLFQDPLDAYELRERCSSGMPAEVELASGCFMLLRSDALQAVAGFNEQFFLYFEDFDLSLRLQRQGTLVFDPQVQVTHYGGYAASKGLHHVRLFAQSAVRFFNLHGWRWL